ncbi:DUF393 domain-containing protein [Halomonas almeriensis]|uniref:thiol-disulfide oxidoreductase DCC family protein n=1 Tax=Halomonas almeriensis TaxID=308163 RepID=UPI0025B30378|nr:DUF393 domain-containing protein [Halomonas almeriensis]MDN3552882.1 DUF393 domain-containing protein [Halomonas almeriensis]
MQETGETTLTLFYDGSCPLCQAEVQHLAKCNTQGRLALVDISAADFAERYPALDAETLDRRLHARDADGQWLTGLDATHAIWSRVGKRHWVRPLEWRWLRWCADPLYNIFARHRHRVTRLLFRRRASDCPPCHSSRGKEEHS